MKKKGIIAVAVLLIVALGIGLWFYGYYHRKSNDNIPSKALIATYYYEKGEAFASEKLEGYKRSQLAEVWGEPQGSLFGFWGEIWDVDDTTYIIVYYRADGGFQDGIVDYVKVFEKEE